jgi:hypothetical protein
MKARHMAGPSPHKEPMKNPILADIVKYATQRLNAAYGFAGVATGDAVAMINSTDKDGNNITIKIDVKPE